MKTLSCLNFHIGVFLFFCVISVLLGLALIVIYGFFIVILWNVVIHIPMHIAIASVFVTLGISEIVTGIWSAVCCCRSCCAVTPSEPVSRPLETFLKNDHSCIHSYFVTPPVGLEAVKTSFEAALSFSQSSCGSPLATTQARRSTF